MTKANQDLRVEAKSMKITWWMIADELGISEPTMTRMLRREMAPCDKERLMQIIHNLAKKREDDTNAEHS